MRTKFTDFQTARALALVTDLDRAIEAPRTIREIAWATLKLARREQLATAATFRHQTWPGDAA